LAPAAITGDLVRVGARAGTYSLASLLCVGGGGAPRAPEQVRQIGKSFTQALPGTGWGMTETNAIGCGIGGEDYLDTAGQLGPLRGGAGPAGGGRAACPANRRTR
jgi:long-chain acyl-CoA synthetase